MRCWQCGAIPQVAIPEKEPVRVICKCGKDLGLLYPKRTEAEAVQPSAPKPPPVLASATLRTASGPAIGLDADDENRRTVQGGGYVGGLFLTLTGFAFMASGAYYLWQADDALDSMTKVEAVVLNVERRDGGRSRGFEATVKFDASDGKSYVTKFPVTGSTRVGSRLSVLYDPNEPTVNRQASFNSLYGFAWAGGGMGVIIFLIGLYSIFRQSADDDKFREDRVAEEERFGSRFPAVCAGCAQGKPTGVWRVCGPTKTVEGPAAVVHTTPFVEVPICRTCLWRFYATYAMMVLCGVGVGAGVFCAIFFQDGDVKTLAAGGILGGGFLGLAAFGIAQYLTRSRVSLGDLDPEKNVIHFKNEYYQELYHQHLAKSGAGYAQAAGALESLLGK